MKLLVGIVSVTNMFQKAIYECNLQRKLLQHYVQKN